MDLVSGQPPGLRPLGRSRRGVKKAGDWMTNVESGVGIDVPFWGFVSHHLPISVGDYIPNSWGDVQLGHLPTPVEGGSGVTSVDGLWRKNHSLVIYTGG